jgi:hypothetical protein
MFNFLLTSFMSKVSLGFLSSYCFRIYINLWYYFVNSAKDYEYYAEYSSGSVAMF